MLFYYILIFISSFILADLQTIVIMTYGTFNLYLIDIYYIIIVFCAVGYLKSQNKINSIALKIYFSLLMFFVIRVLTNLHTYSFSAIGEARYVGGLFAVFVPLFLFRKDQKLNTDKIILIFYKTIVIAAIAGVILFIIEMSIGHRFFISSFNINSIEYLEDFRGFRILGSEETYNLSVVVVLIICGAVVNKKIKKIELLIALILLIIILITKNRAAPLALFSITPLFLLIAGKYKNAFFISLVIVTSLILIDIYSSGTLKQIVLTFSGISNIQSDDTGNWRYLVQLSALEEGLNTPIFGQGFGGYFHFYVPEMNQVITAPPHSSYIYLFLKTGILGIVLYISLIISFVVSFYRKRKIIALNKDHLKFALFFIILILSQLVYGLAYQGSEFFGLYFGFGVLFLKSLEDQNLIINQTTLKSYV